MENDRDIFNTELNEKGVAHIQKILWLAGACFWAGLLVNLVTLYYQVDYYFKYAGSPMIDKSARTGILILSLYVLFTVVLNILGSYFFLRYAQKNKKAAHTGDSAGFNESFTWQHKAFWMILANTIINGLYLIYVFGWDKM
jgi:hypothetical protein